MIVFMTESVLTLTPSCAEARTFSLEGAESFATAVEDSGTEVFG